MRSSEALYRDLIHGLPVAVYTCDAKGYIEFFNEAAVQLWGIEPVIGKSRWSGCEKMFKPDGTPLKIEDSPVAIALKEGSQVSQELIIERPDSSRRSVIHHTRPTSSGAKGTGVINSLIDITPQVEARMQIEESENLFSTLANNIPNLAWMADATGWIFWYNQSWYDYTGTTLEEMEGWGWKSVHDPDQLPMVLERWQQSISTGEPFEMIFPLKGADNEFRTFLTRVFPIYNQEGAIMRWLGTNTDIHEQKKFSESLEATLKESEEQMKAILHYAPDAVISIDDHGRILSWNPESEIIFGWKEQEVLGKKLTETIIPERFRDRHDHGMEHYLMTGEGPVINKAIEVFALKRNKEEFPIELKISSTKINGRHLFIGFIRDITLRKRSQETIRNKTQQLVEAQELAHIGSWEWDVPNDTIEWSEELYRIYGLVPGDFEPKFENYLNRVHEEDREYVHHMVQKALKDHQPFNFIHRVIYPDGTVRIISATGKVITDQQGQSIKMAGTSQDVTEQKKYEAELKESEERFFQIFENNPIPLSLTEIKTNKIRYVNNPFCSTFGYTKEEIVGHSADEMALLSPEEYKRVIDHIYSYLDEQRSIQELRSLSVEETEKLLLKLKESDAMKGFEVKYTSKKGETFPVIISFEVIRLKTESYTVTSYTDITERKKAEMKLKSQNIQLEKINKELESFTYISSHDLQEPLRKIQLFAGRISEEEFHNLSEKGRDQFDRMYSAAEKMQTLIQDLLSYSRTNTVIGELENTDLNKVVEEVKTELRDTIEEKKAVIETGALGTAPVLQFQFRQLIHNLISNSLKFSRPEHPPHIVIEREIINGKNIRGENLQPDKNYYHLIFRDNGIGFEEGYNEKIFEVFQRLHSPENYPGTGIGLAIVKKIVENHNGVIIATGEPDKGTTFDIYIPAN